MPSTPVQPEGPHRSWVFRVSRTLSRWVIIAMYRARAQNRSVVPAHGALLIAANHQSYLDPPLVGGYVTQRECHFVARAGLFKFAPFGRFLEALNCIPIREEQGDAGAIREVLRRLARGEAVVIFPEGSRCHDGAMTPFKRGVALLVKRAKVPVVPAAVEGCFDAWPRGRRPRLLGARVVVRYGEPIPYDDLMKDGPDAALARLQRQIDAMRLELRAELRQASGGAFPAPGPGDRPFVPSAPVPSPASPPAGP